MKILVAHRNSQAKTSCNSLGRYCSEPTEADPVQPLKLEAFHPEVVHACLDLDHKRVPKAPFEEDSFSVPWTSHSDLDAKDPWVQTSLVGQVAH